MALTDDYLDDMETTVHGQATTDLAYVGFGRGDGTAEATTNTALDDEILDYRGDETSRYDVTNPGGNTYRYTYDGTGTAPDFSGDNARVLRVDAATAFAAGNQGDFPITNVDGAGAWVEVTNAAGVVEADIVSGDAEGIGVANRLTLTLTWSGITKKLTGEVELDFADSNGHTIKEIGIFDGDEVTDNLQAREVIPSFSKTNAEKLKIEVEVEVLISQ